MEKFQSKNDKQYCPRCGASITDKTTVCPECGASSFRKKPFLLYESEKKSIRVICSAIFILIITFIGIIVFLTIRIQEY